MEFWHDFLSNDVSTCQGIDNFIYEACIGIDGRKMSKEKVSENLIVVALGDRKAAAFYKENYVLTIDLKLIR